MINNHCKKKRCPLQHSNIGWLVMADTIFRSHAAGSFRTWLPVSMSRSSCFQPPRLISSVRNIRIVRSAWTQGRQLSCTWAVDQIQSHTCKSILISKHIRKRLPPCLTKNVKWILQGSEGNMKGEPLKASLRHIQETHFL